MAEQETILEGGADTTIVRVGATVRREGRRWSPAVLDLLRHIERAGFTGAPRALGFDEDGREVLSYIEGEVGAAGEVLPEAGGRYDRRLPAFVWHDEVLSRVGAMLRAYHDAASDFRWEDRDWRLQARLPIETICHNDLTPWNTIFHSGLPIAFVDWDAAAPGPRSWDIGFVAWRWVPFWRDEKCRAHGLPVGAPEKARRFRLLLDAYGIRPEPNLLRTLVERMRNLHEHLSLLAAEGAEWETTLSRRGVLDEMALEIAWVEQHATILAM